MRRAAQIGLLLLLAASVTWNVLLLRRNRAMQNVRQQEIAYTKAAATRTYRILPEYGMRFMDSVAATQPVPHFTMDFRGMSIQAGSEERPLSYGAAGSSGGLCVDISQFHAPPRVAPGRTPAPTPQTYVVHSFLRQLIEQDGGWWGVGMDGDTDVAMGYAAHPAGMVTVLAYPDERAPSTRIVVRYTHGFLCGPLRGGGSCIQNGTELQPPSPRPVFFRPDEP